MSIFTMSFWRIAVEKGNYFTINRHTSKRDSARRSRRDAIGVARKGLRRDTESAGRQESTRMMYILSASGFPGNTESAESAESAGSSGITGIRRAILGALRNFLHPLGIFAESP